MSTMSQTVLDSIFAGHINETKTVPDEAGLKELAEHSGASVEHIKDAFAAKWKAAGNLDDPFGRHQEKDEEDEE